MWLKKYRIDASTWSDALHGASALRHLDVQEQDRLKELTQAFLRRKSIEPVQGLQLDESMRVNIAAQACLLILNLKLDMYSDFRSVIVYPGAFRVNHPHIDSAGVHHSDDLVLSGEAWLHGPVVLSWDGITQPHSGSNVIIHEFAHKLDGLNGVHNGFPPLNPKQSPSKWSRIFNAGFTEFNQQLLCGQPPAIDPYAAENPAEFFAVTSEAFFEMPWLLRSSFPDVYDQLAAFYGQDPISRTAGLEAMNNGITHQ